MAKGISTRLTTAEGRRFGLTVGTAFLVFAGIAWWRGHLRVAAVLATLGGVLVLAGLLIPRQLGPVERAWMKLAHIISKVTTPIVMAVMYLVVLTPVGFIRRTAGGDPLAHAPAERGFWKERHANARQSASMRRQF